MIDPPQWHSTDASTAVHAELDEWWRLRAEEWFEFPIRPDQEQSIAAPEEPGSDVVPQPGEDYPQASQQEIAVDGANAYGSV